ncbi:putative ATP-dependent DNA helicase YjcD [Clostridium tepidiprofundi DSM 19306]|uniref:DNA 3'-5' helicase n=1 Tax=Clostridium tepidiprofundi DSM 19306 TaxID=1121338 RepID=A0A151B540_9CLOT|nr:ATP-dependent helicase [Clostridium tepidiprofundi]KYH35006.1 putative ATP-dependent DNA helicase YjcD [Clostridium tepidiprofundi DSM 19306]
MNFEENLDKFQRIAVKTDERNLLVVAAPGSGKTTTIINRVFYLVKKGVSPDNIVVITFTRMAAINMKNRYSELGIQKRSPFFGTFHGLFYKIVKRHYGNIEIIGSSQSYNVIKSVLKEYFDEITDEKVKETLNDISVFKNSLIDIEFFKSTMDKNIFNDCFIKYEEYKKRNKLLDFDDLQIKVRELFLKNENILNGYRMLFKYILVDEFQDCDKLQIDILRLLNLNNSLFAVGDEDQCIYSFRGSRPDCMVEFDKYFDGGKKVFLSNNYRSPKNIIEASNKLIINNKIRNSKTINAVKKVDSKINVINSNDENGQANEISNIILKLNKISNYKLSSNVVLYRTNIESRSLIDAFIRKRIPFRFFDRGYNFFEHFICRDIIAYLKLSIDPCDRESFTRIINKPFRYVSKINIEKLKNHREKNSCFEILKNMGNVHPYQIKSLEKLQNEINFLSKISLKSAVDYVIFSLGYHEYIEEYCSKFKYNIDEMEEIVEEFRESCKEFNFINEFLVHVEEVSSEIKRNKNDENRDSVIFSTIHGVKGMEFENVFIINCNEDNIPHKNNDNIEEERRLFYVAVTRTKKNLWLGISDRIKGSTKEPSRFINELGINKDTSVDILKKGEVIRHVSFGIGKVINIDEKVVDIEFDEGIVRRFDALILFNSGLIKQVN